MQKQSIKSTGPGAPKVVPSPGATSAVGPSKAAPKPRVKNTRDYGKKPPAPADTPTPFGPTEPLGRFGGL